MTVGALGTGRADVAQQADTIRDVAARIERLPFSGWHVKARVLIGTATFFDAFDALTIAQVLPVLRPLWHLTGPETGLLISTGYLGQLAGAILAGLCAERFGRITTLVGCITIFSLTSLLCGLAPNYETLLGLRIVQGLGLGGQVPIAAVYISEIAKAHGRGRFVILYECIFTVGLFLSGLVGSVVVPRIGWEAMFFIGAAPIVIALVLKRMLPESPRWLASRGRLEAAERAVGQIEADIVRRSGRPLDPPRASVPADPKRASWRDIVGPGYLRRSLLVWLIWFSTFLVTYGLGTWLPTLYRSVFDLPLETALRFGTIGSLMQLCGGLTSGFVIDRLGRRRMFAISFFGAAAALGLIWIVGLQSVWQFAVLSGTAYYFAGLSVASIYLYTPEVYPTRARAVGTSIGSAWLRLASMVGPMLIGAFVGQGIQTVFLVFAAVALFAGVCVSIFGIETSERALEEISQ